MKIGKVYKRTLKQYELEYKIGDPKKSRYWLGTGIHMFAKNAYQFKDYPDLNLLNLTHVYKGFEYYTNLFLDKEVALKLTKVDEVDAKFKIIEVKTFEDKEFCNYEIEFDCGTRIERDDNPSLYDYLMFVVGKLA